MTRHHRPDWVGRTVVCVATGPSLCLTDCGRIYAARARELVRVIAVSDAYRLAPFADAVFSADLLWWKLHHAELQRAGVRSELWSGDNVAAKRFGLQRVRMANRKGLGTHELHTGGNSGYMAINLAWLWGARSAILVGYDMQRAPDGRRHFFGDHPAPLTQVQLFPEWLHRFDALATDLAARGFAVVNATRQTALRCFPQADLDDALAQAHAQAQEPAVPA